MTEFPEYIQKFELFNNRILDVILREETADFNAIHACLIDDEYDLKGFNFKDDDVIIDIGSGTGGEALFISAIRPKTRIFCFEPLPENTDILRQNLIINKMRNCRIFQMAVTGRNGKIKIHYGNIESESGRHHHFIGNPLNVPKGEPIEVRAITLESIFNDNNIEHAKMVRMDPEGAELEILRDCPAEILEKIDWIIGEHHLVPRAEILKATKGLFRDVPCPYQEDGNLGHFRFARIIK